MNHSLIVVLLGIFKWVCVGLCAYALILGLIAAFGFVVSLFKLLSKKQKNFSFFYLVKVVVAAAVAYGYFFLYQYKGFTPNSFLADPPKTAIILLVALCVPIGLLMAIDRFIFNEPVRN